MDDFEKELKQGFLEEASQLLVDAEQCFLALESTPDDQSILEKIFRLAHNIKGSSKAVGFSDLGAFTHEFESFLLKLKNKTLPVNTQAINLLLRCADHVRATIDALKLDFTATLDNSSLITELQSYNTSAPAITSAHAAPQSETFTAEDVKALENLEQQRCDLSPKAVFSETAQITQQALQKQPPSDLPRQQITPKLATASSSEESIRVSLTRLERLLNYVGELVILQTVLREQANAENLTGLKKTIHQMGKVSKEVQDISMGLRMVPLKQTFQKMQRIVRDTAQLLEKKVQLIIEGEETELDKTVLENLADPLVHLIRNAVDHGVELPADRTLKGKFESGTIRLSARHQSGSLVIEVRDDGQGIDPARLRAKAIEKGIITAESRLSDTEAVQLIFHPGFSTKAVVTEVSGRGVGMDVVKTNIERLHGEISIQTKTGEGSTFRITLPLTLAIIDAMIIRSEQDRFVIPLSYVHESVRTKPEEIKTVTGLGEVLMLRGENLPLFRLSQLLGRKTKAEAAQKNAEIALIIRSQSQAFAAVVDDILGQHEVVIKKMGPEVQHIKGFSGSAILGDGRPALILEIGELVTKRRAA